MQSGTRREIFLGNAKIDTGPPKRYRAPLLLRLIAIHSTDVKNERMMTFA